MHTLPDTSGMVKGKRAAATKPRRYYIRDWRKHRGLTLEQLAELAGLTASSISQLEIGRMGYSRESLERLADALDAEPGDLLSRPPTQGDPVAGMLADVSPEERERIIDVIRVLTARR
jgi:transcriptional regulator with XRE-family HTH domain